MSPFPPQCFEVVLVAPSGHLNAAWSVSGATYSRLRDEATRAVTYLDDPDVDSFQVIGVVQCQKKWSVFQLFGTQNFVLWTFSLLKMAIFSLLSSISSLPMLLTTVLAKHKT